MDENLYEKVWLIKIIHGDTNERIATGLKIGIDQVNAIIADYRRDFVKSVIDSLSISFAA